MATVASVDLTQPASDPDIGEGQTFTMGGQATKGAHGGMDYDLHFEWDQGLGDAPANYAGIPASAAALTCPAPNPLLNQGDTVELTKTVAGESMGSYFIRVRTVDHNDGEAEELSASQTVTVTEAAGPPPGSLAAMGIGR